MVMRTVESALLAEISKSHFWPVFLVWIDWPGDPVRAHSGVGEITFGGFACAASAGLRGGPAAPGAIAVVTLPEAVDLHFDAALAFGMPAGWWVRLENAVITLPFDAALECWHA